MRTLATLTCTLLLLASVATAENWPHWRGPSRNGVSGEVGLPCSWGAKCATASLDSPRIPFGPTSNPVAARVTQRGQRGLVVVLAALVEAAVDSARTALNSSKTILHGNFAFPPTADPHRSSGAT